MTIWLTSCQIINVGNVENLYLTIGAWIRLSTVIKCKNLEPVTLIPICGCHILHTHHFIVHITVISLSSFYDCHRLSSSTFSADSHLLESSNASPNTSVLIMKAYLLLHHATHHNKGVANCLHLVHHPPVYKDVKSRK